MVNFLIILALSLIFTLIVHVHLVCSEFIHNFRLVGVILLVFPLILAIVFNLFIPIFFSDALIIARVRDLLLLLLSLESHHLFLTYLLTITIVNSLVVLFLLVVYTWLLLLLSLEHRQLLLLLLIQHIKPPLGYLSHVRAREVC